MNERESSISLAEALKQREKGALLVDVRTPSEFADATIPGAVNVPIFSDDERARVGTVYKQSGNRTARRLGVELVAPKIPGLIAQVDEALQGRTMPVLVFCWRGGMRSRAMVDFLNLAGTPARQIEGGHKAFRRHVLDYFESQQWGRLLVLRGLTGTGKTRILRQLQEQDYPVLDLERLACHRGSAFGAVGLEGQPSQKNFEAQLWDAMRQFPPGSYALSEGESRHIGRLILPKQVHAALQVEISLWIETPLEKRIDIILEDYPARESQAEHFRKPISALTPRLGKEKVTRLLESLAAGAWRELVRELMIDYYDPLYRHTHPQRCIEIDMQSWEEGMEQLRAAIERLLGERAG